MKKANQILLLLFWIFPFMTLAQEQITGVVVHETEKEGTSLAKGKDTIEWRNKHIDICFTSMKMSQDEIADFKSNCGVAFVVGRSYYLHKRPIAKYLRFGIDATWIDLNYANYKFQHKTFWNIEKYQYHQVEYSMHLGGSLNAMPVKNILVNSYFHYVPTFSSLFIDDNIYGNYASLFCVGGSVSYGVIGVGVEGRFGNCQYKSLKDASSSFKKTYNGVRVYITFRLKK